uniref:Uncharacterized protein n=1 Tax=Sexangularia sp. CB-2014 TaxID=1486929 RepID=A0A7S1VJF8_9EUKA
MDRSWSTVEYGESSHLLGGTVHPPSQPQASQPHHTQHLLKQLQTKGYTFELVKNKLHVFVVLDVSVSVEQVALAFAVAPGVLRRLNGIPSYMTMIVPYTTIVVPMGPGEGKRVPDMVELRGGSGGQREEEEGSRRRRRRKPWETDEQDAEAAHRDGAASSSSSATSDTAAAALHRIPQGWAVFKEGDDGRTGSTVDTTTKPRSSSQLFSL